MYTVVEMIGVLTFVLATATPQPLHEITARAPNGTTATIVFWLKPSPREGEDAVGPIIGGGTLRLTSHGRTLSIPLSRLGMVSEGPKWTQIIVNPRLPCYARPISINQDANGHDVVTVRFAFVGKGCLPWTIVIKATTGAIISSQ